MLETAGSGDDVWKLQNHNESIDENYQIKQNTGSVLVYD